MIYKMPLHLRSFRVWSGPFSAMRWLFSEWRRAVKKKWRDPKKRYVKGHRASDTPCPLSLGHTFDTRGRLSGTVWLDSFRLSRRMVHCGRLCLRVDVETLLKALSHCWYSWATAFGNAKETCLQDPATQQQQQYVDEHVVWRHASPTCH